MDRPAGGHDGERFLLRLCNPGEYAPEEVGSELAWLLRLRHDEGLLVPEPVRTRDGGLLTRAAVDEAAEAAAPWCCALFRWVPGQVLQGNLTPEAVGGVGTLLARLHRAAERFEPPPGFARPRWDCDRLFGTAAEGEVVPRDMDDPLVSRRAREILAEAAAVVRQTAEGLGQGPGVFGMIHKDLEPDNIVISDGAPCAIDFGDCGWGWFLYDVAASLLPLREKKGFAEMRDAFLAGYRSVRPLTSEEEELVETFTIARSLFAIRLMLRETMSIPKVREYAQVAIPHMLGEIRRFLERRGGFAGGGESVDEAGRMTTLQFLGRLRELGIKVWAEGERLRFSAPQGALTPELKAELAERKQEVLAFLDQGSRAAGPGPMPPEVAASGRLPLSFAQERLWDRHRLEPRSAAGHVARAVRLAGPVRPDLLERGLRQAVRRHSILRTTFGEAEGRPYQTVAAVTAILPVVDLGSLSAEARQPEAERLAAELAHRPFDLERGPLLRLVLLRLEPREHVAVAVLHGLVGDDWSAGLLFREIGALYEAYATERAPLLPEPPLQYADFAWWQREHLQGETLEKPLAFWRQELAGAPARAALPFDRPSARIEGRGERHASLLPPEVIEPLRELGESQGGATLSMVLLAAFAALLARVSGQDDLVVGSPFAHRGRPELDGLIGPFVNALALRVRLAGDPTFRELVGRVRQTVLAAQAHQELPIEALRDGSVHHPPFSVTFSLQNVPAPDLQVATFRMTLLPPIARVAQVDLAVDMKDMPEGVRVSWRYRPELFEAATVARLAEAYLALLKDVGRCPDRLSSVLLPAEVTAAS
ncbi:MAG TPA: condensation domain-containing protein [Thermoanaerobaculia bacterium]|nr:condensation domain-containing protein [Thermoanaerobaculia bacterium]